MPNKYITKPKRRTHSGVSAKTSSRVSQTHPISLGFGRGMDRGEGMTCADANNHDGTNIFLLFPSAITAATDGEMMQHICYDGKANLVSAVLGVKEGKL